MRAIADSELTKHIIHIPFRILLTLLWIRDPSPDLQHCIVLSLWRFILYADKTHRSFLGVFWGALNFWTHQKTPRKIVDYVFCPGLRIQIRIRIRINLICWIRIRI
jgi:hypothetical protein